MASSSTKTYSLYFSPRQKAESERVEQGGGGRHGAGFPGSYMFFDTQANARYEATEYVPDRWFLGIHFRGKPTYRDAKLVATKIPARALRRQERTENAADGVIMV